MWTSNGLRASVVAAVIVAWPLLASAQGQSGQQNTGSTTTQQGQTEPQQGTPPPGQQSAPPAGQPAQPPQATQGGFGQGAGQSENTRQLALSHLTAARQALADMTKLPAASHLEGQARNQVNELISNFNALITSTGPEWRQAYDRVQANLAALIGPENGQQGEGAGAVGTTGTAPAPSLDPSISAKLNDVRQQVDQFGSVVGVQPGQSAEAQAGAPSGQAATGAGTAQGASSMGTSAAPNEAALRNIDQIGAILSRILAQPSMSPNQDTVTVSRQDLQQIQQYLNQLRQSVGGQGPNR